MKNKTTILAMLLILLLCALPFLKAKAESGTALSAPGEGKLAEDARAFTDNGIPVLTLTVDPEEFQKVLESERHEYQAENCSIRIDLPEGWTCEYGEPDAETLGRELRLKYFRGRGNSTWFENKKPFKFRLEESMDILSMGANEHWVLLANAKDESLLRNRLICFIGDALGLAYTPRSVPVDLVVNGEYQGSYLLIEQVRIGENRIEIDKIKKSDTEEPGISGGYLLSMAPSEKDPDAGKITLDSGLSFLIEEPEVDEYGEAQQEALKAQKDYVAAYLQQVEDAAFGEDLRNADGKAVSELMDLESAARYWWVQCFTYNDDGFASTSTYLYKERNGRLYWGPLWDFDRSFWINGDADDLNNAAMPWLDHLRENDPEYQQILRRTWDSLDAVLEEVIREGGVLDRYREEIRRSWEKDRELYRGPAPAEDELDRAAETIRLNISIRREAIREIADTALFKVHAEASFTDGDRILARKSVRAGELLSADDIPQAPEKDGFVFLHWADEWGMPVSSSTRVSADVTFHAVYREKETESEAETQPAPPEEGGNGPAPWIAGGAAALLAVGAAAFIAARRKAGKGSDGTTG